MEITVNIYGRDYSMISFQEYNETGSNDGVLFEGIEYDEGLAKLIVTSFLKSENENIRQGRYKVEKNDKRTQNSSLQLYSEYQGELYYQNIVGVISKKGYTLPEESIMKYSSELPEEKRKELSGHIYHVRLQIRSRFDGAHTYFLPTMFRHGNLEVNEYQVPQSSDDLFDFLLVFEFVRKLKDAYQNGLYRRYQRFNRNDGCLRGGIQVARHIRLNAGMQNGNIAYSYRENTVDNVINHLILYTYGFIKRHYTSLNDRLIERDFKCKRILNELQANSKIFGKINIGKVMQQCSKPVAQPFYAGYEKLRQICFMLLRHMGISVFDGAGEDRIEGILFYIPDLWEDFLESIMKEKIHGLEIESQKEIKVYQKDEEYMQRTYPDFILLHERHPVCVLDAKFKEKWEEGEEKQQKGFDLNDYTKCIRDMNSVNAHATGVIYPVKKKVDLTEDYVRHSISLYNQQDHFYKFPIYIPSSDKINYTDWLKEFDNSLAETTEIMLQWLTEEIIK